MTLDRMLDAFPLPHFVKIDVEGAEEHVLRGGTRLLTQLRPQLYIEVGSTQCQSVTGFLREHGYSLFDGNSVADPGNPVEMCTFNTLAIPTEKLDSINEARARMAA